MGLYEEVVEPVKGLLSEFGGKRTPCYKGEENGFFPTPSSPSELMKSCKICQRCPFRKKCLTYGVTNEETGIWGGYYLYKGNIMRGKSAFLGYPGIRTETVEEMFEEFYEPIPLSKLDDYNKGIWDPEHGYIDRDRDDESEKGDVSFEESA